MVLKEMSMSSLDLAPVMTIFPDEKIKRQTLTGYTIRYINPGNDSGWN